MPDARIAHVLGVGFWTPQLTSWSAAARAFRGEGTLSDPPATRPAPTMLAPTERRRAPDNVAVALEVAAHACEDAGLDPRSLPSVFACTQGDLAISDYISATLAQSPELVSPTKFHNSVHNAAAGYWSIATGCTEAYTAVSAPAGTFGSGLLEALTQAQCDGRPVLFVAYDSDARGPLATVVKSRGLLGAALIVAPSAGRHTVATLRWRLRAGSDSTPARSTAAASAARNAMAGCLPLLEALAARAPATVRVAAHQTLLLEIELAPAIASGP
jgi:Beta-ketoacyl synthase, N-terminal domain